MNRTEAAFGELIARFSRWAAKQEDIRAAVVVGSRARTNVPADEWSDLDLLVVTTNPDRYIRESSWLSEMGEVWLTFIEDTVAGGQERRALYEPGLDVDYVPCRPETLRQMIQIPQIALVMRRGNRVLLDKDNDMAGISLPPEPALGPPSQAQFDQVVSDYLYHAVWVAKKLRRGEWWTALGSLGGGMKWLLLRMIEWRSRATHGWVQDTWHDGRFLEQWADPQVLDELQHTFAQYEERDLWRALHASVSMFRRLAMETAARGEFTYPVEGDLHVVALLQELTPQR